MAENTELDAETVHRYPVLDSFRARLWIQLTAMLGMDRYVNWQLMVRVREWQRKQHGR